LGFAVSQEKVPVDRGTLKQSGFQPEFRGNDLVFGYTQPYAKDVEEGSEPEVPDWDSIQEWSRRTFGISDEDWLYVVTRGVWSKIAREGTEPQPYLKPSAERMDQWLDSHGISEFY